jgi:hypothetical protein
MVTQGLYVCGEFEGGMHFAVDCVAAMLTSCLSIRLRPITRIMSVPKVIVYSLLYDHTLYSCDFSQPSVNTVVSGDTKRRFVVVGTSATYCGGLEIESRLRDRLSALYFYQAF